MNTKTYYAHTHFQLICVLSVLSHIYFSLLSKSYLIFKVSRFLIFDGFSFGQKCLLAGIAYKA